MRRREFISLLGGALAAAPSIAQAQPSKKIPTVAYLWHAGSAKEESPYYEALLEGFSRLGYVDGRDFRLLHRFPNEMPERFRSMAAELVSMNVDVLMGGATASPYLRDATKTIPIVFMFVPDPVGMKLVENLARPGGNATGLANFGSDIAGKRLQLLQELVPGLSRVGLLTNSNQEVARLYANVVSAAADQLGLTLQQFEPHSLDEVEPALDAMVKAGMQAMTVTQGGTFFQARHIIPKLALARGLPMSAPSRETFEEGELLSYAPHTIDMCRRSAIYVDKILKGAKPAELPVERDDMLALKMDETYRGAGRHVLSLIERRKDQIRQRKALKS